MNNSQKGFISPIILALIVLLVVGGGAYVYVHTANWKTYTNTKYGYTLSYPGDVSLQPLYEEERLPDTESVAIIIGPGGTSGVRVGIYTWVTIPVPDVYGDANDVDNPNYQIQINRENVEDIIENNRIVKLDLRSFSEALRQRIVDDKSSNLPNKKVGGLEEITFAGQKAYEITVSGYSDGHGFSTGDPFRYIYLDNGNNKFGLQYSFKGDLSKQIIETFKFTQATSTAQISNSQTANDSIAGRVCGGSTAGNSSDCPAGYICKYPANHSLGAIDGACAKNTDKSKETSIIIKSPNG